MTPESTLKPGMLMGYLDGVITRVEDNTIEPQDMDKLREMVKDVKKKFFEQMAKETS